MAEGKEGKGGEAGRRRFGTSSRRVGFALATLAFGALATGCAASGGASGGALEAGAFTHDARVRHTFRTEGSAHEFRTLFGALDVGAFRGPGTRARRNGASLSPTPFAFAGIGFPQIETAPFEGRGRARRFERLLDWRRSADGTPAGRPIPYIRCMNLPARTVARRGAPFFPTIERIAAEHGLDAALVKAVVARESCFDPGAVSRAGALGLMQLMPATARELRSGNPRKPANNLRAGIRYLAEMHVMFGSTELALAAYNAGPGNVRRYGGIPPFAETRAYIERVLAYQRRYRAVDLYASL